LAEDVGPPRGEADREDSQGSEEIPLDGWAGRAGAGGLIGPYSVEAYAAEDGSEACISLFGGWAYCSADGGATVRRLELEFSRLEPHGGWVGEAYRPRGCRHSRRRNTRILWGATARRTSGGQGA